MVFRSVFVTVTVASGTLAPLASVTVPTMLPVISWAHSITSFRHTFRHRRITAGRTRRELIANMKSSYLFVGYE
jgi:hypothetical protein